MEVALTRTTAGRLRRAGCVLIVVLLTGSCTSSPKHDPATLLRQLAGHVNAPRASTARLEYGGPGAIDTLPPYMTSVFDDVNSFWQNAFSAAHVKYRAVEPIWVPPPFTTDSNCGTAGDSSGAFYCPGDAKGGPIHQKDRVYAPVAWTFQAVYQQAPEHSDVSVALEIAHQVSHHVQHSLGLIVGSQPAFCCQLAGRVVELHADCLTGVWARRTYPQGDLGPPVILGVMNVLSKAADLSKLFPQAADVHPSAEDAAQSFTVGFQSGDVAQCLPPSLRTP